MAKVQPNFKSQFQKNLAFQENYGSQRSPFSPEWTGAEGDRAAIMRIVYPTPQSKQYFNSANYNAFRRNYVTTALQGSGRSIGDAVMLTGKDDYTPQKGRSKDMRKTEYALVSMTPENEMWLGAAAVALAGMFFFI
jgi:hypothetical protein